MFFDRKRGVFVLDDKFFLDRNGLRHYIDTAETVLNHECTISSFDDEKDDEIKKAEIFVKRLKKRKTINKDITSYGLKHCAERFLRQGVYKDKIGDAYVSNGALIVTMIKNGYKYIVDKAYYRAMGFHSLTVMFNVSVANYKKRIYGTNRIC